VAGDVHNEKNNDKDSSISLYKRGARMSLFPRFKSKSVHRAMVVLGICGIMASGVFAANPYSQRYTIMYNKIHDPANGYFSQEGVPYHSVETFICEAPDYGHETTSESFSYLLWLEAMQGKFTGNWKSFNDAWTLIEKYAIPTAAQQPTNSFYPKATKPATYAPEGELPSMYPAMLDGGVSVGADPISVELNTAYGSYDIYGMHWLWDVDNWYGYGNLGDGTSRVSYINTFQRGTQESVWETVPHPSWEKFKWGGPNGFLDLFTGDAGYKNQWRYTNAPDADARAVQATYWAYLWAKEQSKEAEIPVDKASKMGDYLRYAMFDKYFKPMGCVSKNEQGATGMDASHYLLSWYYAWGGATDLQAGWAWRIGCSHSHFGYQNPMAAWILSQEPAFKPKSPNASKDWAQSLTRQLEFYRWLQSADGAIAGGATNSWNGRYEAPPAGTPKFYKMAYQESPVYSDPGSNTWLGWQAWSMQRVAEYFYLTKDLKAAAVLAPWVAWIKKVVTFPTATTFQAPASMKWSGKPAGDWNPAAPAANPGLTVTVEESGLDIGVDASLARTLMYYVAGQIKAGATPDAEAKLIAQKIIDRMWFNHLDAKGVACEEARGDYKRLYDTISIPAGWTGKMANGDPIQKGSTFFSIRSKYKDDPDFARVDAAIKAGTKPVFKYHRFWAQVEVALAQGDWATLFPQDTVQTIDIKLPVVQRTYNRSADLQKISLNGRMLRISGIQRNSALSIFGLDGRMLWGGKLEYDTDVDMSRFPEGTYLVQVSSSKAAKMHKVILTR
jgi:hypothetical protein